MAEVLGAVASGVTLAALFKTCIEAFDLIQASRHQEDDFKKLKLRLSIEKCRLYIWGELMGLTDTTEVVHERPIDTVPFPDVIREILEAVFKSFHDSHKIKEKYGCRQATSNDVLDLEQNGPVRNLAAPFSNFSTPPSHHSRSSRIVQNLNWVIQDRRKFGTLVADVKYLIDGLQNITSPTVAVTQQKKRMRRTILDVHDAETLSLIAEVCSEDHPDVADAASAKADTMSLASTQRRHVTDWIESVEEVQEDHGERMSPDLESLTVAELKQKVLEMRQERNERRVPSSTTEQMTVSPPENSRADMPSRLDSVKGSSKTTSASVRSPSIGQDLQTGIGTGQSDTDEDFPPYTYIMPRKRNKFPSNTPRETQLSSNSVEPRKRGWPIPYFYSPPYSKPPRSPYQTYGNVQVSSVADQQNSEDQTPRPHNYGAQFQREPIDVHNLLTDSSVSDMSASSDHNYLHNPESASDSVHDPTDGSSVASFSNLTSFSNRTLPPPQGLSNTSPATGKKHRCKVCDKRFTRPSSLQTHMYTHTGEKPYACDFKGCGRYFSVPSNLRRHRKVHKHDGEDNKKLRCDPNS